LRPVYLKREHFCRVCPLRQLILFLERYTFFKVEFRFEKCRRASSVLSVKEFPESTRE